LVWVAITQAVVLVLLATWLSSRGGERREERGERREERDAEKRGGMDGVGRCTGTRAT